MMLGIFVNLFIDEVTMTKVNFRFRKLGRNTPYLRTSHFLGKILVSLFISNVHGKNFVKKLCTVLEMELKTYTPI